MSNGKYRHYVNEAERICSESTVEEQTVSNTIVCRVQRLLS